jgi:hypothetical protein
VVHACDVRTSEDHKFEASLSYILKLISKTKHNEKEPIFSNQLPHDFFGVSSSLKQDHC